MRRELHSDDKTHAHCMPEFQLPDEAVGDWARTVWRTTGLARNTPFEACLQHQSCRTLTKSKDRPHVVMYWIVSDFAKISKDIDIAPPIQSRVYQELSNGMLGNRGSVIVGHVAMSRSLMLEYDGPSADRLHLNEYKPDTVHLTETDKHSQRHWG